MLLGVLKPAILATDVHLSQLPQSLSEMRNHYQGSFHAGSQSSFVVIDRYTPRLRPSRTRPAKISTPNVYALAGEHVAQLLVIRAQDLRILQKMLGFVRDKCVDDSCTGIKDSC